MKCEEFEELVVERWDEELEPGDERRLERHLDECEGARGRGALLYPPALARAEESRGHSPKRATRSGRRRALGQASGRATKASLA